MSQGHLYSRFVFCFFLKCDEYRCQVAGNTQPSVLFPVQHIAETTQASRLCSVKTKSPLTPDQLSSSSPGDGRLGGPQKKHLDYGEPQHIRHHSTVCRFRRESTQDVKSPVQILQPRTVELSHTKRITCRKSNVLTPSDELKSSIFTGNWISLNHKILRCLLEPRDIRGYKDRKGFD